MAVPLDPRLRSPSRSVLKIPTVGKVAGQSESGEDIVGTGDPVEALLLQLLVVLKRDVIDPTPRVVLDKQPTSAGAFDSDLYHWIGANALSLHTVNTTDVSMRVQVHVNSEPNTSLLMRVPVHEWDVGSGEHIHEAIDPRAGDTWGEWAWFHLLPLGTPTQGNIRGIISNPGRLG